MFTIKNLSPLMVGIILLGIGVMATAAVSFLFPYQPDQPPYADDVSSTSQGIQEVISANNKFAFDLYSELNKSEEGNLFYSPYSVSTALAMTYEGARGQTADEMQSVFYFPESNILRPNFAAIYNSINEENESYDLKTGNALWAQYDFPFLEDYTSSVERYYGGKVANLDFVTETENSRQIINSFIEVQTNNKIKNLIPEGFIDPSTKLVLTNAIYFKGTWRWEFDSSNTYEENFKVTPTNIVKTPMMHMSPEEVRFNYANTENLQILELPYKGEKISMLVLLPKENLEIVEESLTIEKLNEYKNQMEETRLDSISLPKFGFDSKYFMKNTLINLGMPTAFSDFADFSGMTGRKDLFIDFVIHQAYINVDEEGTEAAAATAVGMKELSVMPENIFRADHPFIFIIQEKDTGSILFLGKIVNPTQ